MGLIFYLAAFFTVFCVVALVIAPFLFKPSAEAQRIMDVVQSNRPDQRTVHRPEQARETVLTLARDLRGRLGLGENAKLKGRLYAAGFRRAAASDVFFGAQILGIVLGMFAGSFIPVNTMFWVFALAVVGYMAPDFWLTRATKKRTHRIRRSVPDAIDLLVICVDAGLGLDQALMRVGEELALSHPDINEEFTQVNLEQRAGKPRLEAWQSLALRTKIEEFTVVCEHADAKRSLWYANFEVAYTLF